MNHTFDPNLSVSSLIETIDLVVVATFLLLTWYLAKSSKQQSNKNINAEHEYLLMGGGLSLPFFVATLTSTWYGGIFGVTQIAFEKGIYSFFTQGLFWYLSYAIFALTFATKIRQSKVMSLPELIGQKFGIKARKLSALILFVHALPITYAISLGLIINLIFLWPLPFCVILGVLFVAGYTSLGGFRSVVITDCLQFILMFSAVILVLLFSVAKFGGLSFLKSHLPNSYFSWQANTSKAHALIWLFIACSTTFVHPAFYQRCLAAKSNKTASIGIFIAIIFWFIFDICTSFGGMYARVLLPNAASEKAYFLYGLQLLPVGLKGLFVSGILATILSTLDSFLFVSATTVSYDLLPSENINKKYRHTAAIFLTSVLVIFISNLAKINFENIWLVLESAVSVSIVWPCIICIYTKKQFSDEDFLAPALIALFSFIIAYFFDTEKLFNIPPFYVAHLLAFIVMLIRLKRHTKRKAKLTILAHP